MKFVNQNGCYNVTIASIFFASLVTGNVDNIVLCSVGNDVKLWGNINHSVCTTGKQYTQDFLSLKDYRQNLYLSDSYSLVKILLRIYLIWNI